MKKLGKEGKTFNAWSFNFKEGRFGDWKIGFFWLLLVLLIASLIGTAIDIQEYINTGTTESRWGFGVAMVVICSFIRFGMWKEWKGDWI